MDGMLGLRATITMDAALISRCDVRGRACLCVTEARYSTP